MMSIARSAVSSASTPLIAEWIAFSGFLIDPYALSFSIYDISTDAKELAPVVQAAKKAGLSLNAYCIQRLAEAVAT